MNNIYTVFSAFLIVIVFSGCGNQTHEQKLSALEADSIKFSPKEYVELKHPEWSKNATIYEVNIRQYTPDGTFNAFKAHLPKLKELGVDIIWLMPVHPIGIKNRKGTLGSYYSVKDYTSINPEFGTMEDFKSLVKRIHDLDMHVIIDWVGNHSSWDNQLAIIHPEWYTKTVSAEFQPTPWYDWHDIIDFDYNQPGLRKYMSDAMRNWVFETDIDGFRCDVAGFIPIDFWEMVRADLDKIKPVFMLAEWESRDLYKKAFDMTYAWSLWDKMHDVTTGKKNIAGLIEYMAHDVNTFPRNAYRMTFTENHDKNSWEGTQFSNFGEGLEAAMVLTCVVNGMPLIYGGQEAGLNRSLSFFEKDSIQWKKHPFFEIYKKLFQLKHKNTALWNGAWGGEMIRVFNDKQDQVLSFARAKNEDKVVVAFNFSDKPLKVKLNSKFHTGSYTEVFSNEVIELKGDDVLELPKWGYIVLVK